MPVIILTSSPDRWPEQDIRIVRIAYVEIEAAGARLIYLPSYSPDLNPIELAFSKLKAHLRKAAERTIARLSRRIGRVGSDFSPRECSNFFRHAGYVGT